MNFDDFLKKTGEKQVSFSKRTGIDNTMICKYLCNVRNPGFFDALKIKAASSGKVTEYDQIISTTLDEIESLKQKAGYWYL